jgi:hypothetical protein
MSNLLELYASPYNPTPVPRPEIYTAERPRETNVRTQNVLSSFQRMMEVLLADVLWVYAIIYVDDLLIYSADVHSHCAHLATVQSTLGRAGAQVRASKARLFCHAHYVGLVFDWTTVPLDNARHQICLGMLTQDS